jgi:hypothetical protein
LAENNLNQDDNNIVDTSVSVYEMNDNTGDVQNQSIKLSENNTTESPINKESLIKPAEDINTGDTNENANIENTVNKGDKNGKFSSDSGNINNFEDRNISAKADFEFKSDNNIEQDIQFSIKNETGVLRDFIFSLQKDKSMWDIKGILFAKTDHSVNVNMGIYNTDLSEDAYSLCLNIQTVLNNDNSGHKIDTNIDFNNGFN